VRNSGYNDTQRLFNFNVSGSTAECESNFRVTWDGPVSQGPYNFSVIPLDGGYKPWFVDVGTEQYYDWKVNMSEGSAFTIMFKWVILASPTLQRLRPVQARDDRASNELLS
jgi:hypothetical protein